MYKQFFPRPELKYRAKEALRGNWLVAILIAIITVVLGGLMYYAQTKISGPMDAAMSTYFMDVTSGTVTTQYTDLMNVYSNNMLLVMLVSVITGVLINGVLELAKIMWYLSVVQNREDRSLSAFFGYFGQGLRGVLAYLWQTLWLTLWSIIYMIPTTIAVSAGLVLSLNTDSDQFSLNPFAIALVVLGVLFYMVLMIRKTLSYSMMFYCLGDHPQMGAIKALRMSKVVTKERLGDLFMLGLSFIGWVILGFVSLGLGLLYVIPYMSATYAQTYLWLRDNALDENRAQPETFGLLRVSDQVNEVETPVPTPIAAPPIETLSAENTTTPEDTTAQTLPEEPKNE